MTTTFTGLHLVPPDGTLCVLLFQAQWKIFSCFRLIKTELSSCYSSWIIIDSWNKSAQERTPRGHLVHPLSQRRVDMVSDTMTVTWWLSFKTLTFPPANLSNHCTEDLHHLSVVGGMYRTVCGVFSVCVCVYIFIYVNVLAGVLMAGVLWLSGFESLSYNRHHEANQTTRGSPQGLVPVFTSLFQIAGISKPYHSMHVCFLMFFA